MLKKKKLLSPNLDPSQLFLRSDDMARTIQSAESLILGLYPLDKTKIHAALVTLNTMDETTDDSNPNSYLCPSLAGYNSAALQTPQSQAFNQSSTQPLLNQLAPLIGVNSSNEVDIWQVWDCLNVHFCHDLEIPEPLVNLYPTVQQNMLFYANQTFSYPNTIQHGKVSSGLFIYEMLEYFELIVNKKAEDPRLIVWSSHDTSLMSFLAAYQVWNNQWVPYASTINLELYEGTGSASDWGLRMIYNGNVLTIPGCDGQELCDYQTFYEISQQLIPSSSECLFPPPLNEKNTEDTRKHFG
jgi:hypothetical protein